MPQQGKNFDQYLLTKINRYAKYRKAAKKFKILLRGLKMNETKETETKTIPFFYTNIVGVSLSPSDVTIDFGYKTPEQAKAKEKTFGIAARVSMSPNLAKTMLIVLKELLSTYEKGIGEIPLELDYKTRYDKAFGKK